MSKVATRASAATTTTTTTTTTTATIPVSSTASGRRQIVSGPGSSSSSRPLQRRDPPPEYSVSIVENNGIRTEVLTIEDTPPVAGPSGTARGSRHYSTASKEGSASRSRKRKNEDGAAAGYGDHHASSSSRHKATNGVEGGSNSISRAAGAGGHGSSARVAGPYDGYSEESKSTASKNKRKLDAGYSGEGSYSRHDSGSSRGDQDSQHRPSQRLKPAIPPVIPVPALPIHDKEGHFIVRIGDVLLDRYRILRPLGQGTFGKVVCAWDMDKRVEVAVKVIRAVPKYREASKIEIKVLEHLKRHDPSNRNKCIHLLHCFDYQNHVCLVSELLSSSVFDFLKENQYAPFPFSQIQNFARQLLGSVAFLHSLKLIHTDLKPENILLADNSFFTITSKSSRATIRSRKVLRNPDIRLIDFGSATFDEEYHASVVSTRHYRAPEIILGLPWSFPCDAWSIGCILIEFYTGEALFQTHENLEHLAMMKTVFGEMPAVFGRRAAKAKPEWFIPGNGRSSRELDYPNAQTTRQSKKFVKQMRGLNQIVSPLKVEHQKFLDLLRHLLRWDPEHRITVQEALDHPFFQLQLSDEGNNPPPDE